MSALIKRWGGKLASTPFVVWSALGNVGIDQLSTSGQLVVLGLASSEVLHNHLMAPHINNAGYQRFLDKQGNHDFKPLREADPRRCACDTLHPKHATCRGFIWHYWSGNAVLAVKLYTGEY